MKTPRFPVSVRRGSVTTRVYRLKRGDGREIFTVSWNVGGRRHTKQFSGYGDAHAEASFKAEQLASGKFTAATVLTSDDGATLAEAEKLCGKTPLLAALREWRRARELSGGQLIQAAEAWSARQGTAYKSETVSVLIARFLKNKKAGGVKTKKTYKPLAHLAEKFGGMQMDVISTLALGKWMQGRYAHPVYFNTALARFRTFWTWARKNGFLPKDAQTVAAAVDTAREKPNRIGIIKTATLKQLLVIVRDDRPELLAPLVLAAFCGLRSSEVHGQQWDDIDLKGGHVRVTVAKPNTPAFRLVPLCDAAKEWLLLCPDRTERVCQTVVDVERIRDLATAAKITMPENAFRHSYISHRVAATSDVNRTALDCGNSPQKIFRNYRSLVSEAEGKEWFSVMPQTVEAVVYPFVKPA